MHITEDTAPIQDIQQQQDQLSFRWQLMQACPRAFFTPAIIAINVAIFLIMVVIGGVDFMTPSVEDLLAWGANFTPYTVGGEWWRLFSCMFLHVGIIHLAFNMWILNDIGKLVERLYGNTLFLFLYVGSGLFGSIASAAINPSIVSAGASGAIFGVFGALFGVLVRYRNTIPRTVFSRLRNSSAMFVGYNVVFGFTMPQIDNAAHLGGLLGGFLLGFATARPLESAARRAAFMSRATVGSLLLAGIMALGPVLLSNHSSPKAQYLTFLHIYGPCERTAIDAYNGAVKTLSEDPETLLHTLESICLPAWNEILTTAETTSIPKDSEYRSNFDSLIRVAQLRSQGLTLIINGIRNKDAAVLEEGRQMQKDADLLSLSP